MIHFFTDPIFRAPTWGCILMCLATSLMGVVIFLRKKSLLSETLSHTAYPGALVGISIVALFFPFGEQWAFLGAIGGAFISSLLGLKAIRLLEEKMGVRSDAALCFVLSVFFGIGIVIASAMQARLPIWKNQIQMLLFGQAATMTDIHIWIYGTLAVFVILFLNLAYRPLQAALFDRNFALTAGVPVIAIERIYFALFLLSLTVGIRSVGVVLMSGMVIAPAVAARQFSDRLHIMLLLAAFFGAASGLLGNILSVEGNLPTGPMIVLVGTAFALLSLLFAPKRGLLFRMIRILKFRQRCLEENILNGIWKKGSFAETPSLLLNYVLWRLKRGGWVKRDLSLTNDGKIKAASIVRLHRLWELYLTESLGFQTQNVHRTAEEMEHILTPEMEEKLTHLLQNPKHDPHDQPIPERR